MNKNLRCKNCGDDKFCIHWHNKEQKCLLECVNCGFHITSIPKRQQKNLIIHKSSLQDFDINEFMRARL